MVEKLSSQLKKVVTTAALNFNGIHHEDFVDNGFQTNPTWREGKRYLRDVALANKLEFDHIYTFTIPDTNQPNQLRFAVMLHDQPFIGDLYEVPTVNIPLIKHLMQTGQPVSTGIYQDAHGRWISALAPIFNENQQITGILEADYRVDRDNTTYRAALRNELIPLLLLFGALLLFGWPATIMLAGRLTKPLKELAEVADYTAAEHWSHPIPEFRLRETHQLAEALDRMRRTIQTQLESLRAFSRKLETEVATRTKDLHNANQDLRFTQNIIRYLNESYSLESSLVKIAFELHPLLRFEHLVLLLPKEPDPEPPAAGLRLDCLAVAFNHNPKLCAKESIILTNSLWESYFETDITTERPPCLGEDQTHIRVLPLKIPTQKIGILMWSYSAQPEPKNQELPETLDEQLAGAVLKFRLIQSQAALNEELKAAQENLRRQTQAQLEYQRTHDNLTKLGNRKWFDSETAIALAQAKVRGERAAVMTIDLDRFRKVNQGFNDKVGDRVLTEMGARIASSIKGRDKIARIDGDEFAVLLPGLFQDQDAVKVADRLLEIIAHPIWVDNIAIHLTAAIGIALFPKDGENQLTLLKAAETAMLVAKKEGGNLHRFYSDTMKRSDTTRIAMESELRQAVARGQLHMHFQPQVDIPSNRIIGAEALMRWIHPEMGFISPAHFIPLAEESGLIVPLGKWAVEQVCHFLETWRGDPLVIGVNLSARQFQQEDLTSFMKTLRNRFDFGENSLELEITESIAMKDVVGTIAVLAELKSLGFHLAIDDFGTGYSSLAYLKRFALDKLKIDKSFIDDVDAQTEDAAIAKAVINMGHSLGLKVIAEGVETESQLAVLREANCDQYQGWLFSKALPKEAFIKLLEVSGTKAD